MGSTPTGSTMRGRPVSTGSAEYSFVPGLMLTATRIKQKTATSRDGKKLAKVLTFPVFTEALQMAA